MARVSLSLHANKRPRYLNTDTCSSSLPYTVNRVLRASWVSLAAACCHFCVHGSRHYLGLPLGFANHTGVNAEGATCLPSGFSQDGWGGASQSEALDCTPY